MRRAPITPEMIKPGARFNAFAADGRELGQRVVIPVGTGPDLDQFILISTEFKNAMNKMRTAENMAEIMTALDGYEPVVKS